MVSSSSISSPSVLFFIGITAVYSAMQYFATSAGMRMAATLIYFLVVIVVQFFLNLGVANQLCGTPQYGTAALVTFIPWFFIFGLLKVVLTVFPGWLGPFSNTLGYGVASLAGLRNTLDSILAPKITSAGSTKKATDALEHIYADPSLLINEITPQNFDSFWETMKGGHLFRQGAEAHRGALLKLVRLKNIVAEFLWFVLAGSLVASVSFNYMVNTTCSQSVADIKKNVTKANADRTKAAAAAEAPRRVYSTHE